MDDLILKINNLKTYFNVKEGVVKAVDGISFEVGKEKTVGIVGESGSGKTVTAQSILKIMPHPGEIVAGDVVFHDQETNEKIDIAKLDPRGEKIRDIRGNDIGYIFQEPMTALSPIHTIGDQISETIVIHDKEKNKKDARKETIELLRDVGMPNPGKHIDSYTFELSGGMRQRAMIAMALACNPQLLIADEPTTAIDVTIQSKIIKLLNDLQSKYGMSILLITHDLGVVAEMADEVVVMYLGKVVEKGTVFDIFDNPAHPYTKALLNSIPVPGKESQEYLSAIKGSVPGPFSIPKGCSFAPRCEHMIDGVCNKKEPEITKISDNHYVSCFLYEEDIEEDIEE